MTKVVAPDQAHVSLRLPAEILVALDRVAAIVDRPRTWVMVRALRQYLDAEGAQLLEDAESLAALDRGEGVSANDVLAELDDLVDRDTPHPQR